MADSISIFSSPFQSFFPYFFLHCHPSPAKRMFIHASDPFKRNHTRFQIVDNKEEGDACATVQWEGCKGHKTLFFSTSKISG